MTTEVFSSYVEVFLVQENGDVVSYATVGNNHGGAPLIWKILGEKYGYTDPNKYTITDPGLERLWKEGPTDYKIRYSERLLLAATFDRVWIARDMIAELAIACDEFYKEYVEGRFVRTISGIGTVLRKVLEEETTVRGIAFNMCSAVTPYWYVYEEGDDFAPRPYNVDRDKEQVRGSYVGKAAWRLSPDDLDDLDSDMRYEP